MIEETKARPETEQSQRVLSRLKNAKVEASDLFLGSNEENFTQDQKINLRNNCRHCSNPDDVLVGISKFSRMTIVPRGSVRGPSWLHTLPPKRLKIGANDNLAVRKTS